MFKRLVYALIFVSFFYCSSDTDRKYSVELRLEKEFNRNMEANDIYFRRLIKDFVVDEEQSLYVLDYPNRLFKIDKTGSLKWEITKTGQGPGEYLRPNDLYYKDGKLYVCDQDGYKVMTFSKEGNFVGEFKVKSGVPSNIAVDSHGIVYVRYFYIVNDSLLQKYDQNGNFLGSIIKKKYSDKNTFFESQLNRIEYCIDNKNNVLVAYNREYLICQYDPDGKLIKKWTRELPYTPEKTRLVMPNPNEMEIKGDTVIRDIAVDKSNRIYVLWGCQGNDQGMQVDLFSSDGMLLSEFKTGIKPYNDFQAISIGQHTDFYVANKLEDTNVYKFSISINPK